jgi:tripartite ATP-independent transporter DctP family solute receptor
MMDSRAFRFSLLLAFQLGCAGVLSQSAASPIEIQLAHNSPPGSIYDLEATEFARRANLALRGKALIKVIGESKLGNDAQMLEKVKKGELDLTMPSTVMSSVSPAFSVFEVPYLVLSREHVRKARHELMTKYFKPAAEAKGLAVLAMWENGFRHVTNNVRPVVAPKDLVGLKIRVPQGSRLLTVFKSYGADATEFPFAQPLIDAIKRGQFDGQENPYIIIKSAKIDEVQTYLSVTSHNYLPVYLVGNTRKLAALPHDVRAAIRKAAEDMQDWCLKIGEKRDAEMRQQLSKTMQINEVNIIAFLAASHPAYVKFAKEVPEGKALIKLLYDPRSFAQATGHTW